MRWRTKFFLAFIFIGSSILLGSFIDPELEHPAQLTCMVYAIAASFFLLILTYGFVVSQTRYQKSVESPKFDLLALEEAEWGK